MATVERARPLLGTLVAIRVSAGDAFCAQRAVDAAFTAVARVHRLMSFHQPDGDVARINSAGAGERLELDPETVRVLRFARALHRACAPFDVVAAAAALVEAGRLPRPARAAADATARDLELDGTAMRWRCPGWIDLGGIAKGYAVDRAIETLQAHGVHSALVNAGGDLRCCGAPELIHVRHPQRPAELIRLGWLRDGALATSAGYEREALVRPRRRAPIRWGAGVSVLAPTCMAADALTKTVRLAPRRARALLQRLRAEALVIGGEVMCCYGESRLWAA
jgi:thiamine biosynthesis lipoprotein